MAVEGGGAGAEGGGGGGGGGVGGVGGQGADADVVVLKMGKISQIVFLKIVESSILLFLVPHISIKEFLPRREN